jgi:hypothetical protein
VLPYREVHLDPIDPVLSFGSVAFRTLHLAVASGDGEPEAGAEPSPPPPLAPAPAPAETAELARFETLIGKRAPDGPPPTGTVSPATLLASDVLGAFSGFLHARYRRHDDLIGRLSGLAWVLEVTGQPELVRAALQDVVRLTRRDYRPERERTRLHPLDWGPLLGVIARCSGWPPWCCCCRRQGWACWWRWASAGCGALPPAAEPPAAGRCRIVEWAGAPKPRQ